MCLEPEQGALCKDQGNLMGQKALEGTFPCPKSLWQPSSRCLEHRPAEVLPPSCALPVGALDKNGARLPLLK